MKSLRKLTLLFRLLFASLVLTVALVLLFKGASVPITAQSPASQQERQIENKVPKHVPLDIKIRKEKEQAWKDLKNENWARDFELEIKNTGQKPIYTFYLNIFFDVPTEFDTESTAGIYYGRPEISDPNVKPTEDDVPIKPGESMVFKIHESVLRAWEIGRREKGRRLPTKVRIEFYQMTFGDGTALMFNKAVPYPLKTSQSSKPSTLQQTGRRRGKWRSTPIKEGGAQVTKRSTGGSFAGNFLFAHSKSASLRVTAQPSESCASGCSRRIANFRVVCYGCPPQNDPVPNETGACSSLDPTSRECTIPETGVVFLCPVHNPVICESEPPPPPPPTPTPTPETCECPPSIGTRVPCPVSVRLTSASIRITVAARRYQE